MQGNTSDSADFYTSTVLERAARPRLTDAELFAAFPDMAAVIEAKLIELDGLRRCLTSTIQIKTAAIKGLCLDEMSEWFWLRWLDVTAGDDLRHIDKDVRRLRRQLHLAIGRPLPPGSITDDMIQRAREFPITDLVNAQLLQRGKTIACACPYHEDRTPSFHIYLDQNRGWCFGCNQGGDAISIAMRIHECSFREAVMMLAGVTA